MTHFKPNTQLPVFSNEDLITINGVTNPVAEFIRTGIVRKIQNSLGETYYLYEGNSEIISSRASNSFILREDV